VAREDSRVGCTHLPRSDCASAQEPVILVDMEAVGYTEVIREIVSRTDLDEFAERVLDSFWDQPEFQRRRPPRAEVLALVRWNIDLVIRWLAEERGPTEAELGLFREQARARAADGTPADLVPGNFRRAARFAWGALLQAARDDERPALLESADLLFEYVDQVSRIFSDVYETTPVDAEEQAARALLGRIGRDEPPQVEDHRFAESIGFEFDRAAYPFVLAARSRGEQEHAQLAARLRGQGALAASEGRRVVGFAVEKAAWGSIALGPDAVLAVGHAAIRHERGPALDELRLVVEAAFARGRTGLVDPDELLPELLLLGAPRLARRLRARLYDRLDADHPELARTLDALIEHDFERAATAAAIPVHRNTLRDRLNRITELTGVDLDTAQGRALAWLAWLEGRLG
jgi:hypothetical protein